VPVPVPRRTAEPRASAGAPTRPPAAPPPSDLKPVQGWGPSGDPAAITTANPYR